VEVKVSAANGASVADSVDRWDLIADRYQEITGGDESSFYRRFAPFLWRQLGRLDGRRVLELGCGSGWLTAKLAAAGAQVIGLDGSSAMVRAARRGNRDLPGQMASFQVWDLGKGLPDGLGQFDAVVSHMVLMDLPLIGRLVRDVATALTPQGTFIFSILHPSFFGHSTSYDPHSATWYRRITGYLEPEQRWITSFGGHHHFHRPLSWYVNQLAQQGLMVSALHEPPSLPAVAKPANEWDDFERWFSTIPTMLALACVRRQPDGRDQEATS
jgi:SAM-dependent methyltransferase